jgi:putative membrane protein
MHNGNHRVMKGVIAGAAGGLAASWIMNQFQAGWSKARTKMENERQRQSHQSQANGEDATMKAAGKIAHALLHRELSRDEKKKLGPVVHYAFGAGMGAVYGAVAEIAPQATFGAGLPYGTAVFLGVDEVALTALGLSKPPKEYPASTHIYALASHLVYGVSLEMVRRSVRRMLD